MRIAFGVFIILIGVLLIVQGFSWDLPMKIIQNFLSLWPFLIILIGLSVLSNVKGLKWLRWVNGALGLLFVAVLLFMPPSYLVWGQMKENPVEVALPPPSEELIYLDFDLSAAKIELLTAPDQDARQIKGFFKSQSDGFVIETFDNRVIFRSDFAFFMPGWNDVLRLYLPMDYLYSTHFKGGVISLTYQPETNIISMIDIESGITHLSMDIKGWLSPLRMRVISGITNAQINVPKDSTYFDDLQGGIRRSSFTFVEKDIQSPMINLAIESGIFNLQVRGQ